MLAIAGGGVHVAFGETGRACAQVSLNRLLQQEGVDAPIAGALGLKPLEDNLGSLRQGADLGAGEGALGGWGPPRRSTRAA